MNRPETIEETGELMAAAGGAGLALRVDHLEPGEVSALAGRIGSEQGRLDILINDIFGDDAYMPGDKKLWEHDVASGLRMLRMSIDTHLITAALALPLMLRHPGGLVIQMTDGTFESNKKYRRGVGFCYDLVKAAVERITIGLTAELDGEQATALGGSSGRSAWLRVRPGPARQWISRLGLTTISSSWMSLGWASSCSWR